MDGKKRETLLVILAILLGVSLVCNGWFSYVIHSVKNAQDRPVNRLKD